MASKKKAPVLKKAPAQKKKPVQKKKAVPQLKAKPRLRVHEMNPAARSRAADARDRRMAARAQEAKDKKRAALAPWDHLPFREQIRGRAAAIDDEQRVLIERLVSVHFNGSLKMHAGPKARLVDLTPFQLAFMDLLHPLRYEEIIAPAQSQLEDYYADEPDKFAMKEFTADVQGIVLPTETSDRWEIRFAREIGATLVVCNMDGWTTESVILVG